ncbi:hypothetical protein [Bacillus mycoides]|uniref:hypothetical protein n=1 Tax=Bacillus mycoides TaxID=1405 RepID=UPI00114DFE1C|nr:hypothetical protein [Bacillus mycoides]
MGDHLDIMNRYTLIAEILKNESGYREFYENKFSKRNKKKIKETQSGGTLVTKIISNKNIFLFLDTCTWLNHAENANYDAFVKIADLHLNYDAMLLIPEQLQIEWDRHKVNKILKNKFSAFDDMLNKTRKFKDKMVSEEDDIDKLNELIRQAEIYKEEVVESINKQLID